MTVTAITPQKRRPNRRSVYVDGAFVFGLHEDEIERLKLAPGQTVTREQLDKLLTQVVFVNARDTALRYLGYRARTRQETAKRLSEDGYPVEIIERVLALMEKYGYIDDIQYARDYAATRLKNYGAMRVRHELKLKGVSEELIDAALPSDEQSEAEAALNWLRRKLSGYKGEQFQIPVSECGTNSPDTREIPFAQRKKLTDALMRRGYSYATAKEALLRYEGEFNDD